MKALFLGLSPQPSNAISIPEEIRRIKQSTRAGTCSIEWVEEWGATPNELTLLMARHRPDVIHISTHGSIRGGLLFREAMALTGESLRAILRTSQVQLRCVLLSACHSNELAREAALVARCAIGFSGDVSDSDAIMFAEQFYGMASLGYSVAEAYVSSIGHLGVPDEVRRNINTVGQALVRPRSVICQLYTRADCGAHRIYLGSSAIEREDVSEVASLAGAPAELVERSIGLRGVLGDRWILINPFAFRTVGALLDMLYLQYLHHRFPPYSYGREWVLERCLDLPEDLYDMYDEDLRWLDPMPCIFPIEALVEPGFDITDWLGNIMWHQLEILPASRLEVRPVRQLYGMVNGEAGHFFKAALYREWELEDSYRPGTYQDERVLNTEHSVLIEMLQRATGPEGRVPIFNVGRMYDRHRRRSPL